jgi:hypothetical protein
VSGFYLQENGISLISEGVYVHSFPLLIELKGVVMYQVSSE